MRQLPADQLLICTVIGAVAGVLPDHEHDQLLRAIDRWLLHDLDLSVADQVWHAIDARRVRQLRPDHAAAWRAFAARLAEHIQRHDAPAPSGRAVAASERLRRWRERPNE